MKITEKPIRNDNYKTFYSLEVGEVFIVVDDDFLKDNAIEFPHEKYFYKTNGKMEDGNAVCLDDGRMKCFHGGLSCCRVDAELVIER